MNKKKFKIQPKIWPKEYTFEEFQRLNPTISENVLINYYNKYLQEYAENYSRHIKHFEDNKKLLSDNLQEIKNRYDNSQHFLEMYYGPQNVSSEAGTYPDFHPTDLKGLKVHFDLQSPSNYTMGGDDTSIAVIRDITGNGYDLRTGALSAQPDLDQNSNGYFRARVNNQKLYFGTKGGTSSFSATYMYFNFIHTNNDINYTDNTITITPAHNLKTGDEIFYLPFLGINFFSNNSADQSSKVPGGIGYTKDDLVNGILSNPLYVIKVSDTIISVATSLGNARKGIKINLTAPDSTDTTALILKPLDLGEAHTVIYVVEDNEVGNWKSNGFGLLLDTLSTGTGKEYFYNWGNAGSPGYSETTEPTSSLGGLNPGIMIENDPMIQTLRMKDSASLGLSDFPYGRTIDRDGKNIEFKVASSGPATGGVRGSKVLSAARSNEIYYGIGNNSNRNNALDGFGDFFMYELLMYDRRLSERECAQVENYLQNKYKGTITLLSDRNITLNQYGR